MTLVAQFMKRFREAAADPRGAPMMKIVFRASSMFAHQ
jgi:hypothetical protein